MSIQKHGKANKVMDQDGMRLMLREMLGESYVEEHGSELTKIFGARTTDRDTEAAGMETKARVDWHGFKEHVLLFSDTKKVVHDFRKDLETKSMVPIFGSAGKWSKRKPELIAVLEARGFNSVGALFLKGLNEHKKSHSSANDTDFDAARGHGTDETGSGRSHSHHSHSHHSHRKHEDERGEAGHKKRKHSK